MPIRQPSDNLGIRQRALNNRVNETFVHNNHFENVKDTTEKLEVDKLYKIDLAAKYKNVDYIVEVLKSADSLYTTRALKKSPWLFDDEHTHIVNPQYLHDGIFPYTSLKMKRKILSHVSLHVRTEERAVLFFDYCVKSKLSNIAFKFALFTSESFRMKVLEDFKPHFNGIVENDQTYIKHFIGRSFTMLTAFLKILDRHVQDVIYTFQYLYKDNNDKYLDLVEKYGRRRFDSNISVDIMKKHKKRVLAKPSLYVQLLEGNSLVKYSTTEDVQIYAVDLLPKTAYSFWAMKYYTQYKYLLDLIPHKETYAFIKKMFNEAYPKWEFETTREFYDQSYYIFMTREQQEIWALNHIQSEKQILGVGRDFIWYGFVNFKEAFETVKKLILVTKDLDVRTEMLIVLVKSAKTNIELETLFMYYHKRHLNETRLNKIRFIKKVIVDHNVYEFNESCWISFHALLISMDMFNNLDYSDDSNVEYKTVTLLYNIVNQMEIPELLMQYALTDFKVNDIRVHKHKLNNEKSTILYEYLYPLYMDVILGYKCKPFTSNDQSLVRRYFDNVVVLMNIYNYTDMETKKIIYQPKRKERYIDRSISDRELLRKLKEDTNVLTLALPEVTECFQRNPYRISNFLKKIKIYFEDDVAKMLLESFERNLEKKLNFKGTKAAVNGIFQLGDQQYKIDFMKKHAPENIKIDLDKIDAQELRIQKAICRYASHSRPPVPLENIMLYLKGDYVQHCLHVFSMFLANLSLPLCLKFVEPLVDAPVSVQKHGIRLAFQCFSVEVLINLITKIWKRSKNVSLRFVIYKALFSKVVEYKDQDLFEVLKKITMDLHEDDEDEIFGMLTSNQLTKEFLGGYYEAAWGAVSHFKNKEPNIQRKFNVIANIRDHIELMREEFIKTVVNEHISNMFIKRNIHFLYNRDNNTAELHQEQWRLVKCFIIYYVSHSDIPNKYVELTRNVLKNCLASWNEVHFDMFVYQKFCFDFIRDLKSVGYSQKGCATDKSIPIFDGILNELVSVLPVHEIYMMVWDLKLTVFNKRLIQRYIDDVGEVDSNSARADCCVNYGKEIGAIVDACIKNGQYFSYLSNDIKNVIKSNVEDLGTHIRYNEVSALISVASGMADRKIVDTLILALQLLPDDCKVDDIKDYKEVLAKISQLQDLKVQCAMHLKLSKHAKRTRLL